MYYNGEIIKEQKTEKAKTIFIYHKSHKDL